MVIENNNDNNNKNFISVEHLFILVTQVLNILQLLLKAFYVYVT